MNKTLSQFEKTIDTILDLKEISEEIRTEPIKEGKWSIREIVGHLYYWDKFNLEKMVPLMVQDADLPKFPDHDEHNEEAMTFLRDYSVETIINNFVVTRKELTERISSLDEDVRFTIGGGKRKFSAESFVKIFVKHDAHHLKQISEKLHTLK
ncbi:DinB family protein [Bacillus suaedae]|uniref:DinB family protein n=1 Tax=Halalkalibacter suaedae TaxID=2822140 RepID=A0A940WYF6_9BACI|nr:DinB family protein [Bacillus suaedae]MBP3953102.1 DinB family protein [Bacillus suaedae]